MTVVVVNLVTVTGGGVMVVVVIVVFVVVVVVVEVFHWVTGAIVDAVNTGSVMLKVSLPTTRVFDTEVTSQVAQGDSAGPPVGRSIGVVWVVRHSTVVLRSDPTVKPTDVALG